MYMHTQDINIFKIPLLWHHCRIVLSFPPASLFNAGKDLVHAVGTCKIFGAH